MWLRWLVTNLARQATQQQVRQAVRSTVEQQLRHRRQDAGEQPARPTVACDVAVIFALPIESGGLVDLLEDYVMERRPAGLCHLGKLQGHQLVIIDAGVGSTAAATAASDVIGIDHPRWVISAGFAGGLHPDLHRGHILMADTIVGLDGRRLSTGLQIPSAQQQQSQGLHVGPLLTVDEIVRLPEQKRELGERHQALACDMETFGVAEACRQHQTRFMAVRVISDALDDQLPPHLEKMLHQKTLSAKLGAAAGALWQKPARAKELWHLREQALKASDRLARFLKSFLAQLPVEPRSGREEGERSI